MSAYGTSPGQRQPLQVIEDTLEVALALLDDPTAGPLDAVMWLSAHLSAVQHVVQPAVRRTLDDRAAVQSLRAGATRIERILRLLEQSLSGDGLVVGLDRNKMGHELLDMVRAQAAMERALLLRLADRLSPDEQRQLGASYQRALEHAPTRPHPHTPHGRLLGAPAFRVNGWRDRLLDTLDARRVTTPKPQHSPVKSSRWGDYVLGGSSTSPRPQTDRAQPGPTGGSALPRRISDLDETTSWESEGGHLPR